jgi:hypothetical protein
MSLLLYIFQVETYLLVLKANRAPPVKRNVKKTKENVSHLSRLLSHYNLFEVPTRKQRRRTALSSQVQYV